MQSSPTPERMTRACIQPGHKAAMRTLPSGSSAQLLDANATRGNVRAMRPDVTFSWVRVFLLRSKREDLFANSFAGAFYAGYREQKTSIHGRRVL